MHNLKAGSFPKSCRNSGYRIQTKYLFKQKRKCLYICRYTYLAHVDVYVIYIYMYIYRERERERQRERARFTVDSVVKAFWKSWQQVLKPWELAGHTASTARSLQMS